MVRTVVVAALLLVSISGCYASHVPPCTDPADAVRPECTPGWCPSGGGPTYREQALDSSTTPDFTSSSITLGDGADIMASSCEASPCAADMAHVIFRDGSELCTSLPPACASGTAPRYFSTTGWRCDAPCDVIIHYGYMFGGQSVCAPAPIACSSGVALFDVYTEEWRCSRDGCDGGTYDPAYLGEELVCIPC